ncbi:GntR family transcriptional regulator [Schaalia suimastitidis]|uniref:GntR family transcriptional regulator n=1 Tax=Schaalia suimastitidis TaxID=121163 RepID=UPI0003FFEE7E|nr:GntR family transcriptional regulator [Schaalia suimastitidis]
MAHTTLDRNSSIPLYVQIEDYLRQAIARGQWAPGARIPSEVALHEQLGASRMTVRGVLSTLVNEGLLYRVPGKGTFVTERRIEARSPAYMGVREQLEAMGFATHTELVECRTTIPAPEIRRALGTDTSTPVREILRRRLVNEGPVSLHRSYIPLHLAPDIEDDDVITEQLCVVLSTKYGLSAAHTKEFLEATAATREEATHLGLKAGAPLLLLKDHIYDASGRIFEYSKILFRGDRITLHFDFTT